MKLRISTLLMMAGSSLLPGCAFFDSPQANATSESPMKIVPFAKVKDSQGSAEAWYTLGRHMQRSGRLEEAAQAYRRALDVDAEYTEARNGLAAVSAGQGDIDQAIAILEALNDTRPGQAHVLANLGYARSLKGQNIEARMLLEQAAALEPESSSIRAKLQAVMVAMGEAEATSGTQPEIEVPVTVALADGRAEEIIVPLSPGIYELRQQGVIAVPAPVLERVHNIAAADATGASPGASTSASSTNTTPTTTAATTAHKANKVDKVDKAATDLLASGQSGSGSMVGSGPQVMVPAGSGGSHEGLMQRIGERVEIVNGNGVTGLARSLRALISGDWKVIRVLNHDSYTVRATRIEYAKSHYAAARQLASDLGIDAQLRPKPAADDVHLRIVLGHDYRSLDPLRSRLSMAVALADE